jgi:hypothetical protein
VCSEQTAIGAVEIATVRNVEYRFSTVAKRRREYRGLLNTYQTEPQCMENGAVGGFWSREPERSITPAPSKVRRLEVC